jgi:phage terminase large subunit GpA-like protein
MRGHPIRYWFKPSGARNDALDHRVYALAALHSRSVPWEVLLRAAPTQPPPAPPFPPKGGSPHGAVTLIAATCSGELFPAPPPAL